MIGATRRVEVGEIQCAIKPDTQADAICLAAAAVHTRVCRVVPAEAGVPGAHDTARRQVARVRWAVEIAMRRVVVGREWHNGLSLRDCCSSKCLYAALYHKNAARDPTS